MFTAAGCVGVPLLALLGLALLAHGVVGWVPVIGAGGILTVLGGAAHLVAARLRRRLDPPAPRPPPQPDRVMRCG